MDKKNLVERLEPLNQLGKSECCDAKNVLNNQTHAMYVLYAQLFLGLNALELALQMIASKMF